MAGCRRFRGFWLRAQETPVQLPVSVLAFLVSVITLATNAQNLSWIQVVIWIVLGLGGLGAALGRVVDDLALEAAGLAAMIAALWFVSAVSLEQAQGFRQIVSVVLNSGALVIGFSIRLYVLRSATRTRKRAAAIIDRRKAADDG